MKISKHLRLLRHLHAHRCFTIKDVQDVTNSNNPYRTVEYLKDKTSGIIKIDHIDVLHSGIRFRVYYTTKQAALDLIGRHGWRIAA